MSAAPHRAFVVAQARSWIGTPYVHQAACKGAGTDCLGLIRGVWCALHNAEPVAVPAYSMDWGERDFSERLWRAAQAHLRPCGPDDPWLIGQVLLFRMRPGAVAKHLGILSKTETEAAFVHAYSGRAVHESALSMPWRRRVVARFEFPQTGEI